MDQDQEYIINRFDFTVIGLCVRYTTLTCNSKSTLLEFRQ